MKRIIIQLDYQSELAEPYETVLESIKQGKEFIFTYCLDFFNFSMLDKGYEVTLSRNEEGSELNLSELLLNNGEYTDKQIRREHNVARLYKAGCFNF